MSDSLFERFFQNEARLFLLAALRVALSEDGQDLTSRGIFAPEDRAQGHILAKEPAVVAGLPIADLVLEFCGGGHQIMQNVDDGEHVGAGAVLAVIEAPAARLLQAERVILNFLCHLSGVATLTARYVEALAGTKTRLLDTRKTLPGLRYPEKYAVLAGGGLNHRKNLSEMLLVKNNHIDRAGGIAPAVARLRAAYAPCPPLEVECRSLDEVRQAVDCSVDRIMFDNMDPDGIRAALALVPDGIETEVSGNVTLENVAEIGRLGADYVSVGRLTHSARSVDMSLRLTPL
jgi:nicotinate-nucleotide pyrophosphorylase (carboxylating)